MIIPCRKGENGEKIYCLKKRKEVEVAKDKERLICLDTTLFCPSQCFRMDMLTVVLKSIRNWAFG